MGEAVGDDVPEGKVTDFKGAVKAKDDETVVFSWIEYPDKATRDAANEKIRSDPKMKEMGASMPFDGQRMIFGGFSPIVEEARSEEHTSELQSLMRISYAVFFFTTQIRRASVCTQVQHSNYIYITIYYK